MYRESEGEEDYKFQEVILDYLTASS